MGDGKQVEAVEEGEDYYHVRFRDPDQFSDIRTPDWADEPAESVQEGSEVRMGDEEGNDDWTVQSVLIPVDAADNDEAVGLGHDIVEKIRS